MYVITFFYSKKQEAKPYLSQRIDNLKYHSSRYLSYLSSNVKQECEMHFMCFSVSVITQFHRYIFRQKETMRLSSIRATEGLELASEQRRGEVIQRDNEDDTFRK